MSGVIEREWFEPKDDGPAELHLYNSLKDEKVKFIPASGSRSKSITWYTCGPTVYDAAHMGHARNYISFDIVRRVLEDYFGYDCLFVMNVTDVDDKIILRARRNYLLKQHATGLSSQQLFELATSAVSGEVDKQGAAVVKARKLVEEVEAELQSNTDKSSTLSRQREELQAAAEQEGKKLDNAEKALKALQGLDSSSSKESILQVAGDYIAAVLDKEHGAGVTDHDIYRAHAARYETEFFDDLDALGCRRPDVITRVSEYIPEILDYVEGIVANGLGYEANGSVYFDTRKFRECGHVYGKLKPWSVGSAMLAAEGESNFETSEKRSPTDFALWKASKPGEPFWESAWGKGRPGWHIECSAMASAVFGQQMDIHSGGEDLKFPHHDNELAQAEAYYHCTGCRQWVNYFLHSGHLSIEGHKMSKSLKNFITIKDALKTFTSRQIRLMFLLSPWWKPITYGEASREEMKSKEAMLKNFFQNVDAAIRAAAAAPTTRWGAAERSLSQDILATQKAVHEALLDSINTQSAMQALSDLIKHVNLYLKAHEKAGTTPVAGILRKATSYVTRILSVFGVVDHPADRPGLSDGVSATDSSAAVPGFLDAFAAFRDDIRGLAKKGAGSADILAACQGLREQVLVSLGVKVEDNSPGKSVWALENPAVLKSEAATRTVSGYLEAFVGFLDQVQGLAKGGAKAGDILAACDSVRDVTLVELGVRLEDKADGKSVWKLDDPAVLKAEVAAKEAEKKAAMRKKAEMNLAKKLAEKKKYDDLMALPSAQEALSDKYSKFDPETGDPTHSKDGTLLEGKPKDKAKKDMDKARKVREPLAKLQADPSLLPNLEAEISRLQELVAGLKVEEA